MADTKKTRAPRSTGWPIDPDEFKDAWVDQYKNPGTTRPKEALAKRLGLTEAVVDRMAFNLRRKGVQLPKLLRKVGTSQLIVDADRLNREIREELVD